MRNINLKQSQQAKGLLKASPMTLKTEIPRKSSSFSYRKEERESSQVHNVARVEENMIPQAGRV